MTFSLPVATAAALKEVGQRMKRSRFVNEAILKAIKGG